MSDSILIKNKTMNFLEITEKVHSLFRCSLLTENVIYDRMFSVWEKIESDTKEDIGRKWMVAKWNSCRRIVCLLIQ